MTDMKEKIPVADLHPHPCTPLSGRADANLKHVKSITDQTKVYITATNTVKVSKNVYIIERHFSGDRDIRTAILSAVKNEAFRI